MATWVFRLQCLALLVMLLAVGAFRFELIGFALLARAFALSALALVALALVALLLLLVSLFRASHSNRGAAVATVGLMLLPVVFILATVGPEGFRVPPIHDISTDLDNPPVFKAVQQFRRESDNSLEHGGEVIAQQQRQAYPYIQPLELNVAPDKAYRLARQVIANLGWQLLAERPELGELEAVEASAVFGFKDDVIVRVSPADAGSRVDMRSVSRVGRSDLGANAKRIERFFQQLAATGSN